MRTVVPASALAPLYVDASQFVESVANKMPMWDADTSYARFEQVEIATVKADIEVSRQKRKGHYLDDVDKLHQDWDALVAWDSMLQRSYVI